MDDRFRRIVQRFCLPPDAVRELEIWAVGVVDRDSDTGPVPARPAPAPAEGPPGLVDRGLLGTGSMGEVRRVWEPVLERELAMKVLLAELVDDGVMVDRFLHEARVLARLRHGSVPSVHRFGRLPDGRPYFTMDLNRGTTLHGQLDRFGVMTRPPLEALAELVAVVARAADALAVAHDAGFVHRDVKPANILVARHDDVTLVDWGLAFPAGLPHHDCVGTPRFMAPEQFVPGTPVTAAADVYALGRTLQRVVEACGADPREVREVAPLQLLVAACTHTEAWRRPQHAAEVAGALTHWLLDFHHLRDARAALEAAGAPVQGPTAEALASERELLSRLGGTV